MRLQDANCVLCSIKVLIITDRTRPASMSTVCQKLTKSQHFKKGLVELTPPGFQHFFWKEKKDLKIQTVLLNQMHRIVPRLLPFTLLYWTTGPLFPFPIIFFFHTVPQLCFPPLQTCFFEIFIPKVV